VSIQKKSLINTLKSAKKANVVKEEVTASPATVSAAKPAPRYANARGSKYAGRGAGVTHAAKALRGGKAPRIVSTKMAS
jgi:hypothetical protein